MSYDDIAAAAQDAQLRMRIAACVATQTGYTVPNGVRNHPVEVAGAIQWACAGQPGWGDAYAYAVSTDVPSPGKDPAVITDGMILSAVQEVLGIS